MFFQNCFACGNSKQNNFAKTNNENAKFVFISPWLSYNNDINCKLNETEKKQFFEQYLNSLKLFCNKNGYLYINPNPYIYNIIKTDYFKYMLDHIHPSDKHEIELYSEAVLYTSP